MYLGILFRVTLHKGRTPRQGKGGRMPDDREHRQPPGKPWHPPTKAARPLPWRPTPYSQTQHLKQMAPRRTLEPPQRPQPSFSPQRQAPRRPQPGQDARLRYAEPVYSPPPRRPPPPSRRNAMALAVGAGVVAAASVVAVIITLHSRNASSAPPPASASTASPVPGSNGNKYVTGPFTVTMTGLAPLPQKYDAVTEQGKPVPESCAVVDVKNTSAAYTGWVAPHVEFVKGQSLDGQVLETDAADPTGGSSGGSSDQLAPGQTQVLYACPQNIPGAEYVEAQLTSVAYGTPAQGTSGGTTVQLKY